MTSFLKLPVPRSAIRHMGHMTLLALSIFVSTIVGGCISDDEPKVVERITVGDTLPQFSVTVNTGETITTERLRGKRGMIVFFNTSCPDCREELPVIQRVYEELRGEAGVVCISREEAGADVASYWASEGLTLPYCARSDRYVYELFASSVIPRIYIYSAGLRVTAIFSDNPLPSDRQLREALDEALD